MIRCTFCLFSLALLSSSNPFSEGFSTSKLISSSRTKKGLCRTRYERNLERRPQLTCNDERTVLLQVAIDPTTATASAGGDSERPYDFISVEEAEEALQLERSRFEGERSELQWLLETQRQQLQDLMNESRENCKSGNTGQNRGIYRRSGEYAIASKRILIRGTHAHADINSMNERRNRKKANVREKRNNADDTYIRMKRLESLLQDAIVENEKLTSQLCNQQHQYNAERNAYENELRDEQHRLHSFRDELHMERAYFETSRRMLERLLEEEQQKVQELEQELFMMMTGEEVFSQRDQSDEQQDEQQRQQHSQKQHQKEQQRQKKRARGEQNGGFSMNINDVQRPLYP